ncbi:MAG: LptF/LptG family permease [Sulfuricurvum sp.]|nr:LptF/LptG family permease [Sulfuricurvum sp.]
MGKLKHYIFSHLNVLFFSIFIPLFTIASVIVMIKIATLTSIVTLNLSEMGKLYLFVLPELLFYTLPIAFVVAGALTFYRLSIDNEMVVFFSLGIPPHYLGRVLLLPAFLLSLLLIIDFLLITPYMNIVNESFYVAKKNEARFNLTASEFGHNFGNWMIFIKTSGKDNGKYGGIALFNKENKEEIFITANEAELINKNGTLQLNLSDGNGYSYTDHAFNYMGFKTLKINDSLDHKIIAYDGLIDYWTNDTRRERKQQTLITNTLLGLFPLLSIFLIVALGVVHARHQKRWIYLWLFLSIIIYYSSIMLLQIWLLYWTIPTVAILWLIATYVFYRKLVANRF